MLPDVCSVGGRLNALLSAVYIYIYIYTGLLLGSKLYSVCCLVALALPCTGYVSCPVSSWYLVCGI